MKRGTTLTSLVVGFAATVALTLGAGGTAHASPPVDPVAALQAVGVPADVAGLAAVATPVANGVDTVNLANRTGGFPGAKVDAIIDHPARQITVVQRWLDYQPSDLRVGWVNLSTGRAGLTGLPNAVPGTLDGIYPAIDRTAVLPTGAGPVLLVVYGRVPGWTGLIPLAPEYFGYLTPAVTVLGV
ncbi:hypothetical protein [Rhodococcoides fascians]|uniref:hypothetical protein n=1 Tax=Rhodococcoides fascians TaxID=1828 RepID=UPI0005695EDF|nr:hypothetical protein [Rhodococcus fascians]